MFITGIGIALPEHRYTQAECWETVQHWDRFCALSPRSRHLIKKVLNGDSGVSTRHLGLADLTEGFMCTPDVMQARFVRYAPLLASQAATRALRAAGLEPEAIDAVIVSTCTGYLCPGLTSYVVERADLRRDVLALDLVGQGCGAALPNLRAGASLVQAGQCRHVLSVCVEVCSAALYFDDDPGVLISACLFGDGAAAAVLSHQPSRTRVLRWREA